MPRYEYVGRLALVPGWTRPPVVLPGVIRQPSYADLEDLATLMIDAYRGTIDYDGETLDDARDEIRSYFTTSATSPLLAHSWVYIDQGAVAAASLAAFWTLREVPLIAYVMTHPAYKQQALGSWLVHRSLCSLHTAGYTEVRAVITAGNVPSEHLFARFGFLRDEQT